MRAWVWFCGVVGFVLVGMGFFYVRTAVLPHGVQPSMLLFGEQRGEEAPSGAGSGETDTLLSLTDPAGDDKGSGSVLYPTHQAFAPHRGLFDLLGFSVGRAGETIHFDLTFGEVTNPFSAPEGFYHQRIDIYIDTLPGEGSLEPFQPGPRVRFHPNFPWDLRLRVAPFSGTRVHTYRDRVDSPGRTRGMTVARQSDGRTIRVSVPISLIGIPGPHWRYYVLVGGFDHFGPDGWRDVSEQEEAWAFGGFSHPEMAPRVIDMLSPKWGWRSQRRQLGGYDVTTGLPALVHPVSASSSETARWVGGVVGLLLFSVGAVWWQRRR